MERVFFLSWEPAVLLFLQEHLPGPVMRFLELFTELGDEMAIILVVGLIYWCIDKRLGMDLSIDLGTAAIFWPCIKDLVRRRRPYLDVPGVTCVKPPHAGDPADLMLQGYSFPSGHAANSITIYGGIALRVRRRWIRAGSVAVIAIVCISRCALGVHFPTDVLAGLASGLIAMAFVRFLRARLGKGLSCLILSVLGLTGFFFCKANDFYTGYGILTGAMLAEQFEMRRVGFDRAESVPEALMRMAGGLAIFFLLSKLLKLPFSADFLNSGSTPAHIVRSARYLVIMFTELGLYPMLFRPMHRLFRGRNR